MIKSKVIQKTKPRDETKHKSWQSVQEQRYELSNHQEHLPPFEMPYILLSQGYLYIFLSTPLQNCYSYFY